MPGQPSTATVPPARRPPARSRAEKVDERRVQLAESALATLGQLGYARTSLREIAQNSPFSHGVVHYYFSNKVELITYCVRHYKKTCVRRYDDVVASSGSAAELCDRFAAELAQTMVDEAPMHRLWYDLRTQAMFEQELREDVVAINATLQQMIWAVVRRYAELRGAEPAFDSGTCYALLDGVFEQALLAHLSGDVGAPGAMVDRVQRVLPTLAG